MFVKQIEYIVLAIVLVTVISGQRHKELHNDVDEFIITNRDECLVFRKIFSCVKYKIAKVLWNAAFYSGREFPQDFQNKTQNDAIAFYFVKLNQSSPVSFYSTTNKQHHARGDTEFSKMWNFLLRTVEKFVQNHGARFHLSGDSGVQIYEQESTGYVEPRGDKKRKKWLIILPLIILMKLAHLKMTLVPLILGVGLVQLTILITGILLYHYLKHNTLCKIQPHLVQTHSHVYDHDPDYSTFTSPSSYVNFHADTALSKDWSNHKAYSPYRSYLDPLGKMHDY